MRLALFGFDRAVTHCDNHARFLRRVATPARLSAARWRVGSWLLGDRAGVAAAATLRARVTSFAFASGDAGQMRAQGPAYAREASSSLLRADVVRRIAWHRAEGHAVALVSVSLAPYLEPRCAAHGLALVCNRMESVDGRVTGRYDRGDIGTRKAEEILARYRLAEYDRVHAYGDSREDRTMQALAHERGYRSRPAA